MIGVLEELIKSIAPKKRDSVGAMCYKFTT